MQSLKVTIPRTDEKTGHPLNPEWHREILQRRGINSWWNKGPVCHQRISQASVDSITHILTPWCNTSLYLALILCVVIISHAVRCILRWIKDRYKLHYIYLFTLEIHCSTIRVKHFLTHHLSTANCAVELTVQDSHTTAGCCCTVAAAHTNALIALPSNLLIPRTVSYFLINYLLGGNHSSPLSGTSAQPISGATGTPVLDFGLTVFRELQPSTGPSPIYVLNPTLVA